jgi:hypothetical protein
MRGALANGKKEFRCRSDRPAVVFPPTRVEGIILKTLFLFLGLAGAAGSMHASSVLYNFNFTGGTVAPTGSFDYDPLATTNPFSSFVVTVNGLSFDFEGPANGVTNTGCGGATGPQSLFNALIGDTGSGCGSQQWQAFLAPLPGGSGFTLLSGTSFNLFQQTPDGPSSVISTSGAFTATAAAVAAPEPGTLGLFFAGAGVLLSWKRIRRSR